MSSDNIELMNFLKEQQKLIIELQQQVKDLNVKINTKPSMPTNGSVTDMVASMDSRNRELSSDIDNKIEKTIDCILRAYGSKQ